VTVTDDHSPITSNQPTSPDCEWAAFTEDAPWVLREDSLAWARGLEVVRDNAKAEVPKLTRPGRVPHLGRMFVVVGRIGWAVGNWWVRKRLGRFASTESSRADLSQRLRGAIEALGATYIKLAQIISSGEGLFPSELVDEFKKCRDQVPAEDFNVVKQTIERDLGRPINEVFASIDSTVLAAASIAQVHRATLLDETEVVIKVQRPDVARLVRTDLKVMAWLAGRLFGRPEDVCACVCFP